MSAVTAHLRQRFLEERTLWVLSVGHAFTHWYSGAFRLMLPFIALDMGLSVTQIGFLMTFRRFTRSFLNMPGALVVDTVGRRGLVMAIALAWVGIPYFLMAFSQTYLFLLACVVMTSFGGEFWHPAAAATLTDQYPGRKGWALAIHRVGGNLGDALAPAAIGLLLAVMTWRSAVLINVVPGLVMAFLIWRFLEGAGEMRARRRQGGMSLAEYWTGFKQVVSNRVILSLSVLSGLRSVASSGLQLFLPVYLAYEAGLSAALIGALIASMEIAGMAGNPLWGGLSDRLGRKRVINSSLLISTVLLILIALARNDWVFVGTIALLGLTLYSVTPILSAWAIDVAPASMSGTTYGFISMCQSLFSALSPLVGGIIADRYGIIYTFYFLAATILVANVCSFFVPSDRPAGAVPAAASGNGVPTGSG